LLRSATIPQKLIKQKEKPREKKESRKNFECNITKIDNKEIRFKLEEVAKLLHDKDTDQIQKSERKRLVDIAEIIYDSCMDPEPIYENLAKIIRSNTSAAKVIFQYYTIKRKL